MDFLFHHFPDVSDEMQSASGRKGDNPMPEYMVQRGDTLWGIARNHGIRYWPNVYFAIQKMRFDRHIPIRT
jgi:nucleoid-associated protein YgaU